MSVEGAGIFFSVFVVIFYMLTMLVAVAAAVFELIGLWKMFVKMGEPGWKGIIPFYSSYVLFQKLWEVKKFWMYIITLIVYIFTYIFGLLLTIFGAIMLGSGASEAAGAIMLIIGIIFLLAAIAAIVLAIVIQVKLYSRVSKAFGKSTGFTVGLVFLSPVFFMILGFDKSVYLGNAQPVQNTPYQY